MDSTEVREWAKAQGIEVRDRGRVPAELVVKFKAQVSGRGESHPPALAEPGVRVSPHRAPTGRPEARAMRAQWAKRRG